MPLVVDFAWPELRMVVEADSQRFHGDWARARADFEDEGWLVARLTALSDAA